MDIFHFNKGSKNYAHVYLNLLLVKNGVRTATLIESSNFKWSTTIAKENFEKFSKAWDNNNLGSMYENDENAPSPRLLVFNKKLVAKLGLNLSKSTTIDSFLGELLDFVCPNELNNPGDQYVWTIYASSDHILDNERVDIRTEICTTTEPSVVEPKIINTVKSYQTVLSKCFKDIVVDYEMTHSPSETTVMSAINSFLAQPSSNSTIKTLFSVKDELANELWNMGFLLTSEEILNSTMTDLTIEKVSLWKNLFFYTIYDPMASFYPLSTEQHEEVSSTLQELEKKLRTFSYMSLDHTD